jgi:hypothetical protein
MTCTIRNRASWTVSFRGNSGQTWHVPPGLAIDVADVEVTDNTKLQKLTQQGVIAVEQSQPPDAATSPREKAPKSRSRAANRSPGE